jgi:hypothetical protein
MVVMVSKASIDLIRQYIIDREGHATKSEVVKFMQNEVPENLKLSRDTTMKVIDNMENIVVSKGERRGQSHKLLIEDKSHFNRIGEELTELEGAIDSMADSMEKVKALCYFDWRSVREKPDRYYLMDINEDFVDAYTYSFDSILETLLTLTSRNVQSQKDASTIYKKIIELKIKLNEQHSSFEVNERIDRVLMEHNALIQAYSKDLQEIDIDVRNYAEMHGIPIDRLTSILISKLKNFRYHFLPEYPDYETSAEQRTETEKNKT